MTAPSVLLAYVKARLDVRDERGATAVEYGLLVALIAAAIVGVVTAFGTDTVAVFEKVTP